MAVVPFYSQMVDFNGEDSGFPNLDEIAKWQNNCCVIACARMIIHYYSGKKVQYWELLQNGLKIKAYNDIGWIHKGLVDLVSEYGVAGRTHRNKTTEELFQTMKKGHVCIVSESAGFRGGLKKRDSDGYFGKGGHLIVGYENNRGEISCNHPSSLQEWNKIDWVVEREMWERSFSGGYMEFYEG